MARAVWDSLDNTAQWALNKQWLDDGIAAGDDFIMAVNEETLDALRKTEPGLSVFKELEYLYSQGYKWDGPNVLRKK